MGDRSVIGFKADKEAVPVFLYSHWGGGDRFADVRRALEEARPRWNDAAYATRICISQIVKEYWTEETGFGISAGHNSFCRPEYDVIVVNWESRTIDTVSAQDSTNVLQTTTFDEVLSPALLG